ncbi:hypothetical protein ABT352_32790 [Streptosporangium sp. NPDC000563]|uniref:hypothetical protein n=1 Tax=Streptosporangium sp. NPDC000563 TaxID=3154366 RepID=UPI003331DCA0
MVMWGNPRHETSPEDKRAAEKRSTTRMIWACFVMSFFYACLSWKQGEQDLAIMAGSCSLLFAVVILADYYRDNPR